MTVRVDKPRHLAIVLIWCQVSLVRGLIRLAIQIATNLVVGWMSARSAT